MCPSEHVDNTSAPTHFYCYERLGCPYRMRYNQVFASYRFCRISFRAHFVRRPIASRVVTYYETRFERVPDATALGIFEFSRKPWVFAYSGHDQRILFFFQPTSGSSDGIESNYRVRNSRALRTDTSL